METSSFLLPICIALLICLVLATLLLKPYLRYRKTTELRLKCETLVRKIDSLPPTYDFLIDDLYLTVARLHALDSEYTLQSFISVSTLMGLRRKAAKIAATSLHQQIQQSGGNPQRQSILRLVLNTHLENAGLTVKDLEGEETSSQSSAS